MLIRFSVENFRSFKGEETLSLTPAKSRIHKGHVLVPEGSGRKVGALPLAVLYGANASGKSNLIRAMDFARTLVLRGTRPDVTTGVVPFRLDPDTAGKPSRFEFVLRHEKVLYTYGFACTDQEVAEEWLFAVLQKHEVRLFERVTEAGKARVELGNQLAGTREARQRLQFVAAGTRRNQLFLTEANDRNVEALAPLVHWFRDHLTIVWPDAEYRPLVLRAHDDAQFAAYLSGFLTVADTGIGGIDLAAETLDEDRHLAGIPPRLRKALMGDLDRAADHSVVLGGNKTLLALRQAQDRSAQVLTLRTKHQTTAGETVLFDMRDESDGTHRLLHLVPALLDLQSNDDVFVIDELDRSLHPHICQLYLEAFLRGVTEHGHRGQMILTTHDTNLLDLDLLRRDEIWFVEKDDKGASHLTSLADFKLVRADLRIDKGYLNGRFGAIPFVGDVERLFADEAQT